jgi:hypothetical protein
MKKFLLIALLTLNTAAIHAATISVLSGSPAVELKTSNTGGTQSALPTTGTVRIGFFSNLDTTTSGLTALRTALSNPQLTPAQFSDYLSSRFVPLGEGFGPGLGISTERTMSIRDSGSPAVRTIGGSVGSNTTSELNFVSGTANAINSSGLVRGTKVFMIVYDGNTTNASAIGVFSATNWVVPGSGSSLNLGLTSVENTDGTIASPGSNAAIETFRGTVGSLVLAATVPEPAFASLLVFGTLLGFRRRRA